MLIDDTTNPASDAGSYPPGQVDNGVTQDYPSSTANVPGRQDSEFQDEFRKREQRGVANQAGYSLGKVKSAAQRLQDTPENREQVKEEAKDRIRKYARDRIKDKLGEEIGDLSGDALKKAAKENIKRAGKKAVSKVGKEVGEQAVKQGAKLAARGAAEVGGKVAAGAAATAGAEGAIAAGSIASAGPTLGLGLLIGLLLEIAMYLGMSDAIDCVFELVKFQTALAKGDTEAAREHHKQARFHAQRGAMLVLMGFALLIALVLGLGIPPFGTVIGAVMMIPLTLYMISGMIFPKVGVLQGLSKKLLQILVILYDLYIIIGILLMLAAILWGVCSSFGLIKDGSWYSAIVGTVASVGAKLVDWARGGDWASTFTQICGDIGKF